MIGDGLIEKKIQRTEVQLKEEYRGMSNPTPDLLKARDNRQSCEDLEARKEISSKDLFGSAAAAQGEKLMP